MKHLSRLAIFLGLLSAGLLSVPAAWSQDPMDSEARREVTGLQARVDSFFENLTDKAIGPSPAVRTLVADGPLRDRTDEVARLIDQATKLEQRYGAYTGNEAVGVKSSGTDLLLLRYLYKAEKFPVLWEFTFYRTESSLGVKRDWSLIALKFDTQLEPIWR